MRALKRWAVLVFACAVGCKANAPQPAPDFSPWIARLADPDPAIRDRAEKELYDAGLPAAAPCFAALATAQDAEQRVRLEQVCSRIEEREGEKFLPNMWWEQWFALRKDKALVGWEKDSASSSMEHDPGTESGQARAWRFLSTVELNLTRLGPHSTVTVSATCRQDSTMSPICVKWTSEQTATSLELLFDPDNNAKRVVVSLPETGYSTLKSGDHTSSLVIDEFVRRVALEINASRLVERAALVERPELTLRLFRCGDPPDGRTREYRVKLEGRDVMTWDGEELPVLKYVEVGPSEKMRDVYYVNKERGLMAGRIRGYDIVRLRRSPFEGALPSSGK